MYRTPLARLRRINYDGGVVWNLGVLSECLFSSLDVLFQVSMSSPESEHSIPVLDAFSRPMRSLRISVTDRCNLRCQYCMPEEEYVWLEREEIMSFEEIAELVRIFTGLGVEKVRLTGGQPLLRRDRDGLLRLPAQKRRIHDLALTHNG